MKKPKNNQKVEYKVGDKTYNGVYIEKEDLFTQGFGMEVDFFFAREVKRWRPMLFERNRTEADVIAVLPLDEMQKAQIIFDLFCDISAKIATNGKITFDTEKEVYVPATKKSIKLDDLYDVLQHSLGHIQYNRWCGKVQKLAKK